MTIIVCNGLEIYKDLFVVLDILEYMGLAGFEPTFIGFFLKPEANCSFQVEL